MDVPPRGKANPGAGARAPPQGWPAGHAERVTAPVSTFRPLSSKFNVQHSRLGVRFSPVVSGPVVRGLVVSGQWSAALMFRRPVMPSSSFTRLRRGINSDTLCA